MTKKVVKRRNRKDPYYLKGVQGDVNKEISVLMDRLKQGTVREDQIHMVETRVSLLMNDTLPKIGERLDKALKRTN